MHLHVCEADMDHKWVARCPRRKNTARPARKRLTQWMRGNWNVAGLSDCWREIWSSQSEKGIARSKEGRGLLRSLLSSKMQLDTFDEDKGWGTNSNSLNKCHGNVKISASPIIMNANNYNSILSIVRVCCLVNRRNLWFPIYLFELFNRFVKYTLAEAQKCAVTLCTIVCLWASIDI